MCTVIHFVLPFDADSAKVGALTETHKTGHGLVEDSTRGGRELAATGHLFEGERLYLVWPWAQCHCGWSPVEFSRVILEALSSGATPWIGVVASWGDPEWDERIKVHPDRFANGEFDDERVLYIVEPDRSPRPITHRHRPRKRRRATMHPQRGEGGLK